MSTPQQLDFLGEEVWVIQHPSADPKGSAYRRKVQFFQNKIKGQHVPSRIKHTLKTARNVHKLNRNGYRNNANVQWPKVWRVRLVWEPLPYDDELFEYCGMTADEKAAAELGIPPAKFYDKPVDSDG